MAKNKVRYYSEKKAKRAVDHQQVLIRKLTRSLNNRTDSEKAWETEIKKIKGATVGVVCDICKKPHVVEFEKWQQGQYERTCYKCRQNQDHEEMQMIIDKIKALLPDDCMAIAEKNGWKYGSIRIIKTRMKQ